MPFFLSFGVSISVSVSLSPCCPLTAKTRFRLSSVSVFRFSLSFVESRAKERTLEIGGENRFKSQSPPPSPSLHIFLGTQTRILLRPHHYHGHHLHHHLNRRHCIVRLRVWNRLGHAAKCWPRLLPHHPGGKMDVWLQFEVPPYPHPLSLVLAPTEAENM